MLLKRKILELVQAREGICLQETLFYMFLTMTTQERLELAQSCHVMGRVTP